MVPQSYVESANKESSVMDVETPEFFEQLLSAGLIPKGQMVRFEYNGRTITEPTTRGY